MPRYQQLRHRYSSHRCHPPTFDGNAFKYPAPEFIWDFEEYVDRISTNSFVSYSDLCYMFNNCMRDDALLWMKVFGRRNSNYDTMKAAFLRTYWGSEVQRRVREDYYYGSYRQRGSTSKTAPYFLGILRRVNNLDSPPSESEFITVISEHFPSNVQYQIRKLFRAVDVYLLLLGRDRIMNRCVHIEFG